MKVLITFGVLFLTELIFLSYHNVNFLFALFVTIVCSPILLVLACGLLEPSKASIEKQKEEEEQEMKRLQKEALLKYLAKGN